MEKRRQSCRRLLWIYFDKYLFRQCTQKLGFKLFISFSGEASHQPINALMIELTVHYERLLYTKLI
tara:strand:- start:439 stop:636 length:198 start_codon:yes stop_codon:yes gene_type:complete